MNSNNDQIMNFNFMARQHLQNKTTAKEIDAMYEKLVESEARYRQLFEQSPYPVLVLSEGKIKLANSEAMKLLETNADSLGKRLLDYIHPDYHDLITTRTEQTLAGVETSPYVYTFQSSSGKEIYLETRCSKITFEGETAILVVGQDITKQKLASVKIAESEEQYRNLIELSPHCILVHQKGRIVFVNQEAIKTLGAKSETELIGNSVFDLIVNEQVNSFQDRIKKMLNHEELPFTQYKIKTLDGRVIDVESKGAVIPFNGLSAIMVVAQDITEKKKLENRIVENEQRFRSLFEYNANSVYSFDLDGYFTSCNHLCEELSGYSSKEILAPIHFLSLIKPDDVEKVIHYFEKCKQGKPQNFRTSIIHKHGNVKHINVTIVPIIVNGEINGIYGIAQDITKQVRIENINKHMAYHDHLTGLPNRSLLDSRLSSELIKAVESKEQLSVLFIDLDRFKIVNDTIGHSKGDLLLKEVTTRLKLCMYQNDVVFRQGGDEFIILLPNSSRKVAANVAKRILKQFSAPFKIDSYDIFTSPSIGISVYPDDGHAPESLIKHADYAMYQAKAAGGQRYEFYSPVNRHTHLNPLKMEMDLHKALDRTEFLLHYQPKISLKTGKVIGVEALIRWNHPETGMIPPDGFIPLAEETGMIIPIGEWALYTACKQNVAWHKKGFTPVISVNLSPRQFTQTNLEETISRILKETGLEPRYLELEITESMTADIERTLSTFQKLKKLGVRISIDDFGTGFSSLNYLKQFPVDTLKIDRSFVKELHNNPNDETIVKTIISMAHHLNLTVVAEGIETKEQLVFMQTHLCDEGQGFFFTRPLPADQLEKEIAEVQTIVEKFGLSKDINERVWSEQLVRMAKKELHETLRLQQGMTFKYKEINGKFIHTLCEGELLYQMGLLPSLVVGKELKDFLPAEVVNKKLSYYQRAWEGEEHVTYEVKVNGIVYYTALSPIKRGGEVVEVIGSCIDITDRKEAEKALIESENKYRLIAENMTDLIGILDCEGQILYASPSHETILGYKSEELVGRTAFEFVHPDDGPFVKIKYEKMAENKSPTSLELRAIHRNGQQLLFECFGTPIINDIGQMESMILVCRDITDRRKAEELLWNSEKLSLVGELAAGVAHEIRNPITSIKGFIQLFQQGFIKDEYFDVILAEFNRIEDIIREFLSLAKPQEIKLKKVSIPRLLREVETLLKSEAHLKDVRFSLEMEPDLPDITCDQNQIKQVLINLCKNSIDAIEKTKDGEISIVALKEESQLIIRVRDNGIGISEERLERLGEPFYSNKEKGTGLGLMLCFRIIREHGGIMTIKSKENHGTTVEIKLPL